MLALAPGGAGCGFSHEFMVKVKVAVPPTSARFIPIVISSLIRLPDPGSIMYTVSDFGTSLVLRLVFPVHFIVPTSGSVAPS